MKNEDEMPEGLPEYSYHDLGCLLSTLWEEDDEKCRDMKSALVMCCLKPKWFWKSLKYQDSADTVKWIFTYPFIDLPLLTNRRAKYIKVVTNWRLDIGK